MQNLKWKAVLIVATVLICLYGIIGIPKSMDELSNNWKNNIRLGLDLKGGTLLVLQVQVQDAIKGVGQQVVDSLQEERRKGGGRKSVAASDPRLVPARQ